MAERKRQSVDDENDSGERVDRPDILIELENGAHGVLCSFQIFIVYTNDFMKKE